MQPPAQALAHQANGIRQSGALARALESGCARWQQQPQQSLLSHQKAMRIQQLDLIRYGKFTDQRMSFPGAACDFHLIVGANEAGKSTTRSAILDLLFGIELRSSYDFLHAKTDMRLGARIEHAGQALEFVRSKARTKSLLDAQGQALPDSALIPFLATTERAFFDQMFGLDHGRLEAGGNAILSASNDVGQILFQSAAGIGSLGAVREQLAAEADKLWAKRSSNDRVYYQAKAELEKAEAALKAATVRTKDWLDVSARVSELEQQRELLRAHYRRVEAQRLGLERVRRVAPALRQWRDAQAELTLLQQVVVLPADAAQVLTASQIELAAAERAHELLAAQANSTRIKLDGLCVDERLLQQQADINALEQRRQQVRPHHGEIERCAAEAKLLWQQVQADARQLGWPAADELALAALLPTLQARSSFIALARRFDLLDLARLNAAAALAEKTAELASLQTQLDSLSASPALLPAALQAALTQARALGDLRASLRRDELRQSRCQAELTTALASLSACGPPGLNSAVLAASGPTLRALRLPAEAAVRQGLQQHSEAQIKHRHLSEQQHVLGHEITSLELEITQFRNTHHPVSRVELAQARAARDWSWQQVKGALLTGDLEPVASSEFEITLKHADGVADQRHDKAREDSELQAKLHAQERLRQHWSEGAAALDQHIATHAAAAAAWASLTAQLGLAGLGLSDVEPWRLARDKVLAAQVAALEAQQEIQATAQADAAARADLKAAFAAAGLAFDFGASLETLILLAAGHVDAVTQAQVRAQELTRQAELTRVAASACTDKAASAESEMAAWLQAWQSAAAGLNLPGVSDAGTVAAADLLCRTMTEIEAKLQQIRELRQLRIDTMQRELSEFAQQLNELRALLEWAPAGQSDDALVLLLTSQLSAALQWRAQAERLGLEWRELEAQTQSAGLRCDEARAKLQPLLQLCAAADVDALRLAINQSDRRRQVQAVLQAALQALEEGGDGLSLVALEAEVAVTDAAQVPPLLAELARETLVLQQAQDGVTAQLTQTGSELAKIAGQDDAARAESERQDALAKMANAAERYIKVHTASRLLQWAIDRYRETKQGPMLSRAGEIFAALTLGSFQRLAVDFEVTPLSLQGLRADGSLVEIAGMSAGTRDQLFLALRLAALELHLGEGQGQGQGRALPFIADDLFINYDDRRARAGLHALARLSQQTQVIFLSHHDHLVPTVREVFGAEVNIVVL